MENTENISKKKRDSNSLKEKKGGKRKKSKKMKNSQNETPNETQENQIEKEISEEEHIEIPEEQLKEEDIQENYKSEEEPEKDTEITQEEQTKEERKQNTQGEILIDPSKTITVEDLKVSKRLKDILKEQGYDSLFPVQSQVIPEIINRIQNIDVSGYIGQGTGDVCVCAPTGSGKTLAYGIPIINAIENRIIRRLRVVVLTPTRDLALQVSDVLEKLCVGTNLSCGTVVGQSSFSEETEKLVDPKTKNSLIDILICTPGRLVDHIQSQSGFTLEHLQFLVIDEADRLLMQSYQDWLKVVLEAAHKNSSSLELSSHQKITARSLNPNRQELQQQIPLMKLLFSATLTRNPTKISAMNLNNPILFRSAHVAKYSVPDTLKEFMVVCEASQKPLLLLHILEKNNFSPTLCFTSSVESTHRLFRLIELYQIVKVAQYSSELSQQERTATLQKFKDGSIQLLICSDAMARGMNLDHVKTVILYDCPSYLTTHIHRIGRTARAGRTGETYTLLRKEEVRYFKGLLKKAENHKANMFKYQKTDLEKYEKTFPQKLVQLQQILEAEKYIAPKKKSIKQTDNSQNSTSNYNDSIAQLLKSQILVNLMNRA